MSENKFEKHDRTRKFLYCLITYLMYIAIYLTGVLIYEFIGMMIELPAWLTFTYDVVLFWIVTKITKKLIRMELIQNFIVTF